MSVTPAHVMGWVVLSGTAYLCLKRGAWPERAGYLIITLNWLLTPFVERRSSWTELQAWIILINLLLVFALGFLAVVSSRTWPLAAIAFESLGVGCRMAPILNAPALQRAVPYADSVIGLLVMGCVTGGVLVEAGSDRSHISLRSR